MIRVSGVTKTFGDARTHTDVLALDGVDLEVVDAEILTIIGPSGCGKTTLLRIIAGLIRADRGQVFVDGVAVTGPGPDRAMVFQSFALLPWMDILSNVSFGLEVRGVSRRQREARARELISLVGLAGFENRIPRQLSGGMQQRVGLARALAVDPRILLMDEPFGALDEQNRRLMQEELLRIWQATIKTVCFITHSMEEAVLLGDRVVLMSARPGRIQEIIDVPLPRPREPDVEKTAPFVELKEYLWEQLRAMQVEPAA